MTIRSDIQKLAPGALVELFILDCEALGGTIHYFHSGTDDDLTEVVFQGNTYTPFPIQASGFEIQGRGQANRPKLSVSNVDGMIGALCRTYDDLVGAKFTRKRTFARYLDGEIGADPTAELPMEIYYIEQKTIENRSTIEYELAGVWDMDGVFLPRRQVVSTICPVTYKSTECGYTGGPVAKRDDTATSDPDLDDCGKRVASCKLRFGENAELPYGGFPAVGRMTG